ncbi:ADP-sugar pyrophosphatase-like [Megalops cyprinoides]|uniref:ADP-sugar pyrophosphatase-like n=1 Tax=Megalops cyprinoides TaxID=118141 RepID=UPI00186564C8|nr:ADP-sugar pyrophosphatase-like [Megalops cyprinoides]
MSNIGDAAKNNVTVPHVVKEEIIAAGKWARLEKTTYVDPSGKTRTWETVKRTTRRSHTATDGVQILAILSRAHHKDFVVLVKQFRPPMGCYTLEFPAGLIDGSESAETAALRELKEETGYRGEVVRVSPVMCLDPGLSNCTTQFVMVSINGDDPDNLRPTQELDDGEFIDVILLPLDGFQIKIDELLQKEDMVVDAKVYIYSVGLQAFTKPSEIPAVRQ